MLSPRENASEQSSEVFSELSDRFSTEIEARLDSVTAEDWKVLYPTLPDPMQLFSFIQETGIAGYSFHSIVIRWDRRPVLYVPLFELELPLYTMLDGIPKLVVRSLTSIIPRALSPRIMAIGFIEGEWSAIGIDRSVDAHVLAAAFRLAARALDALFLGCGADLRLYVNLLEKDVRDVIPRHMTEGFQPILSYPSATLPIAFKTIDDYLNLLSKGARKDLRRKLKKAEGVRVVRVEDPGPYLDTIYRLYLEYVNRHDFQFGVENRSYFEHISKKVPGAHYVLYFLDDKLVAFNLLVRTGSILIDKHFAMENDGLERAIYFFSWIENVKYCLDQGLGIYMVGTSAESTKARFGGRFLPSMTMFRHKNPLVHKLLAILSPLIAYKPEIDLRSAALDENDLVLDDTSES